MKLDEIILFLAFRYALGRRTYVVHDVTETIIRNWDNLSLKYQSLIHKEIKQAIEDENAGMDMDIERWRKILQLILKK